MQFFCLDACIIVCSLVLCTSSRAVHAAAVAAAAMQEAVGLLNGAFANLAIKGQKVGLPAPGNMPAFALRRNAGGGGRAGKATGEEGLGLMCRQRECTRTHAFSLVFALQ
jgi:hypothetical protein